MKTGIIWTDLAKEASHLQDWSLSGITGETTFKVIIIPIFIYLFYTTPFSHEAGLKAANNNINTMKIKNTPQLL